MTTQLSELQSSIRQFIVGNFYVGSEVSLDTDTSLLESGIIDSTGVLELIRFLESTYSFEVSDREVIPQNLDTIGNLVEYVFRKTKGENEVGLGTKQAVAEDRR